jgi:hypothetical protein
VDRHEEADGWVRQNRLFSEVKIYKPISIAIYKDSDSSDLEHGERGGKSRQRRHEHLVAGIATGASEPYLKRVKATGNANCEGTPPELGQFSFERLNFGPENVPAAFADRPDCIHDLRAHISPLPLEII